MFQFARTLCSRRRSRRWRAGSPALAPTARPWNWRGGSPKPKFDLNRVRNRRRLLITQFLVDPYFVPRHIRRLQLWGLHLALGARFRVLPIEIHKIEVHKIKEIFSPIPPESEEKLAAILGKRLRSLPRSIDTSGALYRDAKPRSAILTRLERLPSRSAKTKINVTYENVRVVQIESIALRAGS